MSRKSELYFISEAYARVNEQGDASTVNMGKGGVLEVQPDGQYPTGESDPNAKKLEAVSSALNSMPEDEKNQYFAQLLLSLIEGNAQEALNLVFKLTQSGQLRSVLSDVNAQKLNTASQKLSTGKRAEVGQQAQPQAEATPEPAPQQ